MPKQLIPVANRPVLEYAIESVRDVGAREIAIVVGDLAKEISAAIGDGSRYGVVLACNRRLLAGQGRAIGGAVGQASDIRGPVIIEPGACVARSRIDGPAIIGAGTVVTDSWVGPSTSVGRHCEVRGTRLSDSVVLDGARLHDAGSLHGSLIGRHATVSAREPQETGHRVVIGDHSRLAIKRG
jgi:glucose-1-phosphate thymidylyltransferase